MHNTNQQFFLSFEIYNVNCQDNNLNYVNFLKHSYEYQTEKKISIETYPSFKRFSFDEFAI